FGHAHRLPALDLLLQQRTDGGDVPLLHQPAPVGVGARLLKDDVRQKEPEEDQPQDRPRHRSPPGMRHEARGVSLVYQPRHSCLMPFRAAANMTASGASLPVQSVKAAAPWRTSIERPPRVRQPRARARASSGVTAGLATMSTTTMPGGICSSV